MNRRRKTQELGKREADATDESQEDPLTIEDWLPPHKVIPVEVSTEAKLIRTDAQAVERAKIDEITNLLYLPEGLTRAERDARIANAIDKYNSIKPADGTEGMLA